MNSPDDSVRLRRRFRRRRLRFPSSNTPALPPLPPRHSVVAAVGSAAVAKRVGSEDCFSLQALSPPPPPLISPLCGEALRVDGLIGCLISIMMG